MFIIVDSREMVTAGYASAFEREGYTSLKLHPGKLKDWLEVTCAQDLRSVEAILLGEGEERSGFVSPIRNHCPEAQIFALEDASSLDNMLQLFFAGVDDVLRKPVHVREIIARVGAFRRRISSRTSSAGIGAIEVFFDGRDPTVYGQVMELPRRERRILEYLVKNKGRRITKTQIFNAVYGVMNDGVDECVVESHISKLRKKLRKRLGYDAIESTRYIGYMLKDGSTPKQQVSDSRRPVQAPQSTTRAFDLAGEKNMGKKQYLSVVGT
ncbi:MAG: winged helix-turn-helix domain-containing protein [Roseibium sp.]|uniref:response regulator transcription factor n=1 Tax=Roseibium sp. TaxID=1936156 RepID=UPI00260FFCDE|nr:winged helix-turn-helix domain-containing protein [Roseibium sp.]MCV0424159.1 winged helix-turn-helix domain-containing protein [Roseibium sp.]